MAQISKITPEQQRRCDEIVEETYAELTRQVGLARMTSRELLSEFNRTRKAFPGTKRGLETEFNAFMKKHKDWKEVTPHLYDCLMYQIEDREKKTKAGEWVPVWCHFRTWLSQRRWEESMTEDDDNE